MFDRSEENPELEGYKPSKSTLPNKGIII